MGMNIFNEGSLTLIYGRMRAGKTNISWLLDEIAQERHNKTILTNKRCWNENVSYVPISTDIHYLNNFQEIKKDIVLGLDEANLFQTSKRALSQEATILEALVSICGHLRTAIYIIIQRKTNYLPMLRELATWEIFKIDKKDWKLEKYDGTEGFFYNCPNQAELTNIDEDTYAFANFGFKLDLQGILEEISKGRNYDEQLRKLKEIAENGYKEYRIGDG